MAVEAEKLLHADRDFRSAFRFVIDRHVAAGRRCEMGGRFGVEPPFQREGEPGRQRGGEFIGRKLRQRRLAEKERGKPIGFCG